MKKLRTLLWKDAITEARSFERFGALTLFAVAVLLTLNFALPAGSDARPKAAAGFVWTALLFASVLEFRRSFESERSEGTLDGLRSAPLDATLLFVAKALSSFIVVGVIAAALIAATAASLVGSMSGVPEAIGIAALGLAGLMAWGTLFAAVAGSSRAGDVMLPILLFPLVVPQTISAVRLMSYFLAGEQLTDLTTGFVLLGAFDLLAWGTSILLFEYVLDE